MTLNNSKIIGYIDESLSHWQPIKQARDAEEYPIDHDKYNIFIASGLSVIETIAGKESGHYTRAIQKQDSLYDHAPKVAAELCALRSAIQNGFLSNVKSLIHASIFKDYLAMADYLNQEEYKDAAAVIGGSTLESHMRLLAGKHNVSVLQQNGKPAKADGINSELYKSGAYSVTEMKNITAWLDIRNNAAHGQYQAYNGRQVAEYLAGIRRFIESHPA